MTLIKKSEVKNYFSDKSERLLASNPGMQRNAAGYLRNESGSGEKPIIEKAAEGSVQKSS